MLKHEIDAGPAQLEYRRKTLNGWNNECQKAEVLLNSGSSMTLRSEVLNVSV